MDTSVDTATRYRLDGPGIGSWWGGWRFSAPVPTGLEAHPLPYIMRTEAFLGVKRPERAVDHPPLLDPRLKKSRAISPLKLLAFMACSRVRILHLTFIHKMEARSYPHFKMKLYQYLKQQ